MHMNMIVWIFKDRKDEHIYVNIRELSMTASSLILHFVACILQKRIAFSVPSQARSTLLLFDM